LLREHRSAANEAKTQNRRTSLLLKIPGMASSPSVTTSDARRTLAEAQSRSLTHRACPFGARPVLVAKPATPFSRCELPGIEWFEASLSSRSAQKSMGCELSEHSQCPKSNAPQPSEALAVPKIECSTAFRSTRSAQNRMLHSLPKHSQCPKSNAPQPSEALAVPKIECSTAFRSTRSGQKPMRCELLEHSGCPESNVLQAREALGVGGYEPCPDA